MGYAIAALAVLALLLLANPKAAQALTSSVSGLIPKITPNLYTLTDSDIEQIAQGNPLNGNRTTVNGTALNDCLRAAIRQRRITCYNPASPVCQGFVDPSMANAIGNNVASVGLQTTSSFAQEGSKLAKAIPLLGSIIGFGEAIFGFIGAHHAAAVREENSVICPALIEINNNLASIDLNMQNGNWNGQGILAALSQLQSNIEQQFQVIPHSGAAGAISDMWNAIVKTYQLIISKSGI